MKFFIPHAQSTEQAESVFDAVVKFNHAPEQKRKIAALAWTHNGMKMSCEVGGEAPSHYQTGAEPVVAILDCGALYKVCTANRGVVRGDAIFVGKTDARATYFDAESDA